MPFNPKGGARPSTAAYNQITDAPLSVGWFPWTGAYFAVAEKFCEDFGGNKMVPSYAGGGREWKWQEVSRYLLSRCEILNDGIIKFFDIT